MTLIKSVSGIRGTIGGNVSEGLTPIDIVKFISAYSQTLRKIKPDGDITVVVGRDARISGVMVEQIVCGTLISCGVNVVDIGLASTPTTEMAVIFEKADGGVIITASHNPVQWNALKLLNNTGDFLSDEEGKELVAIAESNTYDFKEVYDLGKITYKDYTDKHIEAVISNRFVDVDAIKEAKFKVVLDPINSVGTIIIPRLLEKLGVECITINSEANGNFSHNPEPLPSNLIELCETVVQQKAHLGISVDPDVDRLAFICENGVPFGEEYTMVSVSDYVLSQVPGNTATNISSTRALKDVTEKYGGKSYVSKVGEANVIAKMREVNAIIGGEGNGGVILPELHYGRDAVVGVALFLSNLAHKKMLPSELRSTYPDYFVSKNKFSFSSEEMAEKIFNVIKENYVHEEVNTSDGVRVDFESERKWVIIRKSNTEPIIRIYAEAPTEEVATALANDIIAIANKVK